MSTAASSALAINGGDPVRGPEKQWPAWPIFDDTEREALSEVLESGKWWYGERVAQFEEEYAAFQDAEHCVTCTSGTTAIEIILQALGVQPGDEVIVPPYTFIATASAVARFGAIPIFVDVDDSWNMNPDLIEEAITERTRAIMPVHFGGRICDMDRINAIAGARGIPVIEDACHSWGSKWQGKGTGALGLCGVFSFQMSKNITAGEGGAILTDNEALAELCLSITNCGRAKGGQWYEHPNIGTNARLTEFAGALLSAQLSRLALQTLLRERNGAFLADELGAIDGIAPQPGDDRITRRAYHLFGLRIDENAFGCSREKVCEAAEAEGIPLSPGYAVPLTKQPAFAGIPGAPDYSKCHCPVAEDICYKSGCWMPHPLLLGSDEDMRDVVDTLTKIKEHAGELAG
jgi:dTDP-4-amino-4,6-dideoxygalactose transaminase